MAANETGPTGDESVNGDGTGSVNQKCRKSWEYTGAFGEQPVSAMIRSPIASSNGPAVVLLRQSAPVRVARISLAAIIGCWMWPPAGRFAGDGRIEMVDCK